MSKAMDDAVKKMHIAAKKFWDDKAKRDKERNPETTSNPDFKKWAENRLAHRNKLENYRKKIEEGALNSLAKKIFAKKRVASVAKKLDDHSQLMRRRADTRAHYGKPGEGSAHRRSVETAVSAEKLRQGKKLQEVLEANLDLKPAKSIKALANKHGVSKDRIEDQIEKGSKVEKEHTNSSKVAKIVAKQHTDEDPNYYNKLAKMEKGKC